MAAAMRHNACPLRLPVVRLARPLLGEMMTNLKNWFDFNDAPTQDGVFGPHDAQVIDTETLRRGLRDQLEAALHHLFPKGRIQGSKFHIGDVEGHDGKSLVVELKGERRGLWKDFATDEGGDAIKLWACVRGLSIQDDFPR